MYLLPIPAFADNYPWLLHDGKRAVVVDPGDAGPVLHMLKEHTLQLESILVTHHHADSVADADILREATDATPILQPCPSRQEGDSVNSLDLLFQRLNGPGHPAGHISFDTPNAEGKPLLFRGDTLFSAGCGRLFKDTFAQMLASPDKVTALPGTTLLCCPRKYAFSNIPFALALEANSTDLDAYQARCVRLRGEDLPTVPSLIAQELLINPFLPTRQATLKPAAHRFDASAHDDSTLSAAIRQ